MSRLAATEEQLRRLVERKHKGSASPLYVVPVRQVVGDFFWEGNVHVFSLTGNSAATEAYAWRCPIGGKNHSRLRSNLIAGPAEAVRASLRELD